MVKRSFDNQNQTINVIQTNNNGCGCGCGTILGAIIIIALVGVLIEEFGPIVTAIPGALLGFWAGAKLCGFDINSIENIDYNDLSSFQQYLLFGGLIFGGVGGYYFGIEFLKELEDNAQLIQSIIPINFV